MPIDRLLVGCAIATTIAVASRSTFRLVETRWQIIGLWLLAPAIELVVIPMAGHRPVCRILFAEMTCIAGACALVKWLIEGHVLS